jgi:hypothetical protein
MSIDPAGRRGIDPDNAERGSALPDKILHLRCKVLQQGLKPGRIQPVKDHPGFTSGSQVESLRAGERDDFNSERPASFESPRIPFPVLFAGNSPGSKVGIEDTG